MVVGIGTGSTVAFVISALAERVRSGLRIRTVATSLRTEAQIRDAGLHYEDFSRLDTVDLCIDGVDEIDRDFRAIKGGGGAMLRERIVADAARRMVAIADSSKAVAILGMVPLPLEVLPFALGTATRQLRELGGKPTVRLTAFSSQFVTDQGNAIIDCAFGHLTEPDRLTAILSTIPGVLGHGLFIDEIDALYIAHGNVVDKRERW